MPRSNGGITHWESLAPAHSHASESWLRRRVSPLSLPAVAALLTINTTVLFHNTRQSFRAGGLIDVGGGYEARFVFFRCCFNG